MRSLTASTTVAALIGITTALLSTAPGAEAAVAPTSNTFTIGADLGTAIAAASCTPANVMPIRRYFTMGVRNGQRSLADATRMCRKVPAPIRANGPQAVNAWLADKHGSHRIPHAAGGTSAARNTMIESARANQQRGARPMSGMDEMRIRAANAVDGARALAPRIGAAGRVAGGGAGVGALALSVPEAVCQTRNVRNGDATVGQAAAEVGKSAALGAGVGALAVVGAVGVSILFPPAAPVMLLAGKATMVVGTAAVAYDTHQAATNPARCS